MSSYVEIPTKNSSGDRRSIQNPYQSISLREHPCAVNDNGIQSHNYEPDESEVWRAHVAQIHYKNRGHWWTNTKKRDFKRWILTFAIGVTQGLVAMACNFVSKSLSRRKFEHVSALLSRAVGEATVTDDVLFQPGDDDEIYGMGGADKTSSSVGSAFFFFLLYQVCFAAFASFFVWVEPLAGGSGIPEIKCFLNGVDLPRVRHDTQIAKTILIRKILHFVCCFTFSWLASRH